ncbi:MAG: hypothetical protein PVG66_05050 [Chromatiales bacterium]|jgi:hypothetical protein
MKTVITSLSCLFLLASADNALGSEPFFVCTDYHCDKGAQVSLTAPQLNPVQELFQSVQNADQERAAIRKAIAYLEQEVGHITGTWRDLGKNYAGSGQPGQLDCISESRNSTTYLHLLQQAGWLKHHEVQPRQRRGVWIIDVHWTAVIKDNHSQQQYAVDSWYLDNGQPPYIQPLKQWLAKKPFENASEN